MTTPVKVLIIDDSISIRMLLREIINSAPDMEVVATAVNPIDAKAKISEFKPDVLTLDVEMPEMDGLTFLEKLMKLNPLPVVMISTLTHKGSTSAIKALELGAVDVVGKPSAEGRALVDRHADEIREKIRAAAYAKVAGRKPIAPAPAPKALETVSSFEALPTDVVLKRSAPKNGGELIVVGSSTGGTEAVKVLLQGLPADLPPIAVVQHISAGFSKSFADRLNAVCQVEVTEAQHNQILRSGHAYIAPGDHHLYVKWNGQHYIAQVVDGERVNRHKPSANVLFRSAADQAGKNALGIILTGMGDDGAAGLKELKDAGGKTIGQDEATCVVYGMPRAAKQLGAVDIEIGLKSIPSAVLKRFRR